jgi:3-hydroxyacyl-CoA dehydrogenase/enoyl-CoA hydratase/3-hydroxybutyryl-CoA epimerase
MLNEAAMCLKEGVVQRADYLDMALIAGIGFPPFRGGLLRYADARGISTIVNRLKELAVACGSRFTPSELLLTLEKDDMTFYSESS